MFKFSLCTSIPHKLCAVPWLAKYICVSMKRDVNKELLTSIYLGIKIGGRARSRRLRQGHPLSNASYIWKYFINCYKNCFEFAFQTIVNTFTTRTVNGTLIDVIIAKCYNQRNLRHISPSPFGKCPHFSVLKIKNTRWTYLRFLGIYLTWCSKEKLS